jgi:hypothetical protein
MKLNASLSCHFRFGAGWKNPIGFMRLHPEATGFQGLERIWHGVCKLDCEPLEEAETEEIDRSDLS